MELRKKKIELKSREYKWQFSAAMVFFILRVWEKQILVKLTLPSVFTQFSILTYKIQVCRAIYFLSLRNSGKEFVSMFPQFQPLRTYLHASFIYILLLIGSSFHGLCLFFPIKFALYFQFSTLWN